MSRLTFCVAFVVGLGAAPVLAAPATPPPAGDTNGNYLGQGRGSGLLGFLSPEQRAMYMREQGVRAMTAKQRAAWRQEEQQKLGAMTETDRLALQTRLQKKWDALPQASKDRIQNRLANRMTQQNSGLQ